MSEEEDVTREEIQEERDFIDACVDTKVMKKIYIFLYVYLKYLYLIHLYTKVMEMAQEWLVSKGLIADDKVTFKRFLHRMWFALYPRLVKGISICLI